MDELLEIEEAVRVSYTARDIETGFLRFESRHMTLSEAADFAKEHVIPTKKTLNWTIEIHKA